jgi:hypothetical protein
MGLVHLIPRVKHDVSSAQKACDCICMRVEQPFLLLGDSIATPVDLHELGKFALQFGGLARTREAIGTHVWI